MKKRKMIKSKIKVGKKASLRKLESIPLKNMRKVHSKKIGGISRNKKETRVSVGISNFDKLIEGGFEKNSINMVLGTSGSGKSIFATQFLIEGMKKGEKCLYITFEEKKSRFYENMKDFGWDLQKYEDKGLFVFLEYTPAKVKTMLEEGGGQIESLVISNKVSRLVIDSITSFALLFEDELEKREAALSLFNMIREWSCTSILTLEEEPREDSRASSRALEFESDSIILLHFVRNKNTRIRSLEILKMRGTKHSKQIFEFDVTKKGIDLKKRALVNFKYM